jgi:hypothetical protein
MLEARRSPPARLLGFALLLIVVSWGLGALAAAPWSASRPDAGVIRVAFKHVAAFEHASAARSREEIEKLPRHMRPTSPERAQTGRRVDTLLRVDVDGHTLLARRYAPGGLRGDGPTFAYEELAVRPGRHLIEVTVADATAEPAKPPAGRQWHLKEEVDLAHGHSPLIELTEDRGLTISGGRPAAGK